MSRALVRLSLLLLVAACDRSLAHDQFDAALRDAHCQRQVRCGEEPDLAACLAARPPRPDRAAALDDALAAGRLDFDADLARACLDRLRAASCLPHLADAALDACADAFLGALADGRPCALDEECASGLCAPAARCGAACCPAACAPVPPLAALGEPCVVAECVAAAYCRKSDDTCAPRLAAGQPCVDPSECGGELTCLGGACRPPLRLGDPCVDGECGRDGLRCDPLTRACAPARFAGAPCDPAADLCAERLRCDPLTRACAPLDLAAAPPLCRADG